MHPSWARAGRKQLILPRLKLTYHEELLRKAIIYEDKLGKKLTLEEVEAIDEEWESDKEVMRQWIDFQLGDRSGLNKHIQ